MDIRQRLALYRANLNRPSIRVLAVPLLFILLSPLLGQFMHSETTEGWSLSVCVLWGPLMAVGIWGGGKAWDDYKRPSYPKELALLAIGLNIIAPFVAVYFVLYS